MDTLQKLKAFVVTAELGSFSDAARKLHASPSVIMKRINELEYNFDIQLFNRTTRSIVLTEAGSVYLARVQEILRLYDETKRGSFMAANEIEGNIRVRSSIVSTLSHLGNVFMKFQDDNPRISLQVTLADSNVSPIEDEVDVAIGFFPVSFEGVSETFLHPYPRLICASPSYILQNGLPNHPHDLMEHRCISYMWSGSAWSFGSPNGDISVNIVPTMTVNNPTYLREITLAGHGIAQISLPVVADCLRDKTLIRLLPEYPIEQQWMKLLVPKQKLDVTRIKRLTEFIIENCAETEPWA